MGSAIASRPEGDSIMAERKFLDFLDRFDGGGAGAMGDKFEGGGLLSLLGNLLASPYGSEDERRAAARRAFYESQAGTDAPMATTDSGLAPKAASLATTGASLAQMPSPDNFHNHPNQTRAVPSTFHNNPNQVAPAPQPTFPSPPPAYTPHGSMGVPTAPAPAQAAFQPIVPQTPGGSVPYMAEYMRDSDFLSPLAAMSYGEYLEYLNTGRYPQR